MNVENSDSFESTWEPSNMPKWDGVDGFTYMIDCIN